MPVSTGILGAAIVLAVVEFGRDGFGVQTLFGRDA